MPIVDRLEYPKKYKMKQTMLLLAILAAGLGILISSWNNKQQLKKIVIHSFKIVEYDRQYIRLGYDIENKGEKFQSVKLLARVYDSEGGEIASALFLADIPAKSREYQTKYLDELNRAMAPGEKPYRVTMQIMQRKLFRLE